MKGEGCHYHFAISAREEDCNTMLLTFTAKFEASKYRGNNIEFTFKDNMTLPKRKILVVEGSSMFKSAQDHALIKTIFHIVNATVLKFMATLTYE